MRDYRALDADLVRWHADLGEIYDQAASMAIVGQVSSSDLGVEFQFTKQCGQRGEVGVGVAIPSNNSLKSAALVRVLHGCA